MANQARYPIATMCRLLEVSTSGYYAWRQRPAKALNDVARIALLIIGTWATERFILDPLADRSNEWLAALKYYWRGSPLFRMIQITIKFKDESTGFEISVSETSDPETLTSIWSQIVEVMNAAEKLRVNGIRVSKIRLIPDGSRNYLILAYTKNRPSFIYDFQDSAFGPISVNTDNSEEEISADIWKLRVLIRRLDYQKAIRELDYDISEEEILATLSDIDELKATFRSG